MSSIPFSRMRIKEKIDDNCKICSEIRDVLENETDPIPKKLKLYLEEWKECHQFPGIETATDLKVLEMIRHSLKTDTKYLKEYYNL